MARLDHPSRRPRDSGLGFHPKNAATYRPQAAATAEGEVPQALQELLVAARRLCSSASWGGGRQVLSVSLPDRSYLIRAA